MLSDNVPNESKACPCSISHKTNIPVRTTKTVMPCFVSMLLGLTCISTICSRQIWTQSETSRYC